MSCLSRTCRGELVEGLSKDRSQCQDEILQALHYSAWVPLLRKPLLPIFLAVYLSICRAFINPLGNVSGSPPEDTPCRTDRGTRGSLPPGSFFNAEVALHRLIDFMVELHGIIRTGLNATGSTHDAPVALLHGHVFRKSGLHFIKGLNSRTRFQMGHLNASSRIECLLLNLCDRLQHLIST